jgi:chromosome segregation ATPase
LSVATAEAAPPVGEDLKTLFAKLGEVFVQTQARTDLRLDRVELRLDRVEGRLDAVEVRLEHVEVRLEHVEGRLEHVEGRLERVEERLSSLEWSTQAGFNRMDARFEQLITLIQRDELKR